jgi:hypothetical protein
MPRNIIRAGIGALSVFNALSSAVPAVTPVTDDMFQVLHFPKTATDIAFSTFKILPAWRDSLKVRSQRCKPCPSIRSLRIAGSCSEYQIGSAITVCCTSSRFFTR